MAVLSKKIPVPRHGNTKYPFAEMEIGESFKVETGKGQQCRNAANFFVKNIRSEWKFTVRQVGNIERCFRIK